MTVTYAVVDLFAGPGGLAEGFFSVRQGEHRPYSIVLSVEKDPNAHKTLQLRAFLRQFRKFPDEYYDFLNGKTDEPNWNAIYPEQWAAATREALCLELGNEAQAAKLNKRLDEIKETYGDRIVLIGGPPCQAYSIVGRVRNHGIKGYEASGDARHFLYREYIRILKRLRPAAFVMENVKGMLSSSVDGERIFDKVLTDLRQAGRGDLGYSLIPLAPEDSRDYDEKIESADYVVRAEDFGVPQARHRVILVGIRKDKAPTPGSPRHLASLPKRKKKPVPVKAVLLGMPRLRSGLNTKKDSCAIWKKEVRSAMARVSRLDYAFGGKALEMIERTFAECIKLARGSRLPKSRTKTIPTGVGRSCPAGLRSWLIDKRLHHLPNCDTRAHMTSDLARYFFVSAFGEARGTSPKAGDFPKELAPEHENWNSGHFKDRFRVQVWNQPSSTITSHICKDGHYFIHPDPLQCRSLTVREAARIQTFPDNYFFQGTRTQQYVQVGNAVPPYLALVIGQSVLRLLGHIIESKRKNP